MRSRWLAMLLALGSAAATQTSAGPPPDCLAPGADCALRELADQLGVRVGAAVAAVPLAEEAVYAETLAREFNSVTAENVMKWQALQPEQGVFDFTRADALLQFAEASEMSVRGHNLVWAQERIDSTPDWVEAAKSPDELRGFLSDHIGTVVARYRGRVDSWDVVNEPLQTLGSELYDNVFHSMLGPDYIALAFDLAHEADPEARLFLNEVLVFNHAGKRDALYALVVALLEQGTPIHGVGFQGHFLSPFVTPVDREEIRESLQRFADLGLAVEITELDIVRGAGEAADAEQRQRYRDVASACMAVEACQRITTWGFTDRHTWLDDLVGPAALPLLFDADYRRKPAFLGYRDGLATRALPEPGAALQVVAVASGVGLLRVRRRGARQGPERAPAPESRERS